LPVLLAKLPLQLALLLPHDKIMCEDQEHRQEHDKPPGIHQHRYGNKNDGLG
jgi:hypothetical protein